MGKRCKRWILQHSLKENVLEKSGKKGIDEVLFKSYHISCKVGVLGKGGADRVNSVQWKYDLCLYKIGTVACERDTQLMLLVFWVHILYSRLYLFRGVEQKHCLSLNRDWITPASSRASSLFLNMESVHSSAISRQTNHTTPRVKLKYENDSNYQFFAYIKITATWVLLILSTFTQNICCQEQCT